MHVNTMSTFNQTTTSLPLSLIATITITTTMLALPACSPDGTVVTTIITAASVSDSGDDESATDGASASTTADPTTTDATTTTTSTTDNPTTEASTYGFGATDTESSSSSTTGEPPPGACGEPGSLFGPCIDGLGCLGNFGCFSRQAGQVCIPTFNWAATHSDEIQACVRQIGGNLICGAEDIIAGWCVVSCGGGTCAPGLACDDGDDQILGDSVCVHPW